MKNAPLAALYRPQSFAQVTGQDLVTNVLSRACATDNVAPAYLLSGTRGVGKTTIARILAKALNCVHAPTQEPCNECEQCQKITLGNHVDVTEIDGASNNSVDDARALRENIGYAAMEGRYKVFIIDEAHMLSRSAFNALLKTLEEPPPRVVFVLATTEVHKFPITIVSRCQHFIFKRVSEEGLVAHLSRVLESEHRPFDPQAVKLIAKRAAGSVRDSMSLLSQTLALGGESLSIENTRNVLGLAGQELFYALMQALAKQDTKNVVDIMQQLTNQGVDIGFFLRELTTLWRTLFLLREAGNSILPSLALAEDEAELWLALAPSFSLAHLHAAWHMTLEAQRKVIHSPEPAAALELLLLNLALMPRLLPLDRADTSAMQQNPAPTAPPSPITPNTSSAATAPVMPQQQPPTARQTADIHQVVDTYKASSPTPSISPPRKQEIHGAQEHRQNSTSKAMPNTSNQESPPWEVQAEKKYHQSNEMTEPNPIISAHMAPNNAQTPEKLAENIVQASTAPRTEPQDISIIAQASDTHPTPQKSHQNTTPPSWEALCDHIVTEGKGLVPAHFLRQAKGTLIHNSLELKCNSLAVFEKLEKLRPIIETISSDYCGFAITITLHKPILKHVPESTLKAEFAAREDMQPCLEILDASISRVRPLE